MTTERFPPVVYAPTVSHPGEPDRLEMQHTPDGRTALFVYSAPDRLDQLYGPDTPWVLLTVAQLQKAYEQVPYDLLFLDRRLEQGAPEPG